MDEGIREKGSSVPNQTDKCSGLSNTTCPSIRSELTLEIINERFQFQLLKNFSAIVSTVATSNGLLW